MEGTEVRKLAQLEDKHWWYAERRHLLAKAIQGLTPGRALDIGAAGGGNTRVLVEHGWSASPLEYGEDGAEVAHERGLPVMRADAMRLPLQDESLDLVVAFDVLEHLEDDDASAREVLRVLRRGGSFLIAVPADPRLWSAHDEAVGHVRRYTRESLLDLLRRNGFEIESVASWMVLLRPAVAIKRRSSSGSDLDDPPRIVNAALRGVVTLERYLPVKRLPGVSLVVRARRP
ncbi:class I SAM-dependent methyltransferase [Luteipulveratus flavus]|uniref:Methyltransferase domain-containing protein n=1 Tax=Luteipulveratus flavus TaxID=3031728 RepID=A0ABT6C2Z9_9MICO|nr:class I SAM-dependent methyltransferase [Luteipulveratus sp. YIM 133296]MDF8263326.1 methyltransferase domain-containing protein [Luteipulveratus sp. YIM 133296]